MGAPIFVARLTVLNGDGTWDSLNLANPREQPRIKFKTGLSLSSEPNEAEIVVFNLADDTTNKINGVVTVRQDWTPAERAELLAAGASAEPFETTSDNAGLGVVELSWGYADSETIADEGELEAALSVGFIGQIYDGPRVEREGNDTLLVMRAKDGGSTLGAAEVVQEAGGGDVAFEGKSYAAGVRISVVLGDMINAIGLTVDVDVLDERLQAAFATKGYPLAEMELGAGYCASGPARKQIENILGGLGLLWSIQNTVFLVLDDQATIPGFAPLVLGPEHIIGKPKRVAPNELDLATAANTEAIPGRPVNVSAEGLEYAGRLFEANTDADTYSGAQVELKLSALGVI